MRGDAGRCAPDDLGPDRQEPAVVVAQSLRAVKQRGPWGGQVRRECTHQAAASPGRSRARTVLENAYPNARLNGPSTLGDLIRQDNSTNNDYQQLANVVILVSLAIDRGARRRVLPHQCGRDPDGAQHQRFPKLCIC